MDHLEEDQERTTGPQQGEETQARQRQSRQQPPQQQWPPQNQGYAAAQQSQYTAPTNRQQFPGQQDMAAIGQAGGTATIMQAQQPAAGQAEYRAQQEAAAAASAGGPESYRHRPAAAAAAAPASYAGFPQQPYQQAPPQQQQLAYHQQAQMALRQQPVHMQQQLPLGVPPMIEHPQPYIQPTQGRLPADRPIVKLSVSLIDTYKHINRVYYEEKNARKAARAAQKAQKGQGTNNNGWDDDNYDYIVTSGELFYGHYVIKERIGKGSFGQVVRAVDTRNNKDVAIKIIKSKKPFLLQAKTEIELLTHLGEQDSGDQNNIVRLLTHFMYRNHQCLVFEMLSLNLYELLKNTQFGGVSLNLIRKFAKQILKALSFLARPEVDIIHCDLKPENILLRHPKRSGVKVIDFGSSCRSNRRMYSYIQSRFYRSPEVMLGLPYSVAIDMWSLGCILSEMHTGEPLFSGSDQFDQMQKIVQLLGMVPTEMIERAGDQHRLQFFEKIGFPGENERWVIKQSNSKSSSPSRSSSKPKIVPSADPINSLTQVIGAQRNRTSSESGNTPQNYKMFVDLIHRMLTYDPEMRISPEDALQHPFILSGEPPPTVG